jgi:hypothetical protein
MAEGLGQRMRAHLELALLADCGCAETLATLTRHARNAGFTGAEIDVALKGRSFEIRTAAAVTYACALKSCEQERVAQARGRTHRLGVSDGELQAIAVESARILAGRAATRGLLRELLARVEARTRAQASPCNDEGPDS